MRMKNINNIIRVVNDTYLMFEVGLFEVDSGEELPYGGVALASDAVVRCCGGCRAPGWLQDAPPLSSNLPFMHTNISSIYTNGVASWPSIKCVCMCAPSIA